MLLYLKRRKRSRQFWVKDWYAFLRSEYTSMKVILVCTHLVIRGGRGWCRCCWQKEPRHCASGFTCLRRRMIHHASLKNALPTSLHWQKLYQIQKYLNFLKHILLGPPYLGCSVLYSSVELLDSPKSITAKPRPRNFFFSKLDRFGSSILKVFNSMPIQVRPAQCR